MYSLSLNSKNFFFGGIFVLILFFQIANGQQSTNFQYSGTVIDGGSGRCSWTNTSFGVGAEDHLYADCTFSGLINITDILIFSNFNFSGSIPVNANITGIEVQISRACSIANGCCDESVKLFSDTGINSSNYAKSCATNLWGTNETQVIYGGSNDMWGLGSINNSVVENINFGVAFEGTNTNNRSSILIDSLGMKFFFFIPQTATSQTTNTQTSAATTTNTQTSAATTNTQTSAATTTNTQTSAGQSSSQNSVFTQMISTSIQSSTTTQNTSGPAVINLQKSSGFFTRQNEIIIAVVIPVGAILLILTTVAVFYIFRSRGSEEERTTFAKDSIDKFPLESIALPAVREEELMISIDKLNDHIENLKKPVLLERPDVTGFHVEFNYIEDKSRSLIPEFTTASMAMNLGRNRYQNVLAQEDTRVRLSEKGGSDYINANFINGQIEGTEKAYIASQGPVQTILEDFWRMVWETNSSVILMLTKEVENMRLKCDPYWADEESPLKLENFLITLIEKKETEELTIRKLSVEYLEKPGEKKEVTQFQYTAWPDHGVPVSTEAFLDLAREADNANTSKGPILVHCSAGIGRTGTFTAIHSTLKRIEKELKENPQKMPVIHLPNIVLNLRKQRHNMVQTVEQYEFCYLAINDGIKNILKELNIVSLKDLSPNVSFIQT